MPLNIHLFSRAVNFAAQVHHNQKRKGKDVPYIAHPMAAALLIARTGADDPIIIAGVLHDTIEDCEPYGSVTRDLLASHFGEDVARMVDEVTEKDRTKPWLERKLEGIKRIKRMKQDSILVKSADVLHNLSELNDDIERDGLKVFAKFNASQKDIITRYSLIIPEIKLYMQENPLMAQLETELEKLIKNSGETRELY